MKTLPEISLHVKQLLRNHGVPYPEGDAVRLIAHALKVDVDDLPLIEEVHYKDHMKIMRLAYRRARRIPLQHILKQVYFYDARLFVNKNVLVPRFDTEILIDLVIRDHKTDKRDLEVLDLCTGSGAIGINLAINYQWNITLLDISRKALRVAKKNVIANGLQNCKILQSDLFNKVKKRYDIITCNPPYIKTDEIKRLHEEVQYDPKMALDGGEDGLGFYRKIIKDLPYYLLPGGKIYFECGIGQEDDVAEMLKKNFEDITIIKDIQGINRVIRGQLKDQIYVEQA